MSRKKTTAKTSFKSVAGGPIVVHVQGHPPFHLEPGETLEVSDPELAAKLRANSDLSEKKGRK